MDSDRKKAEKGSRAASFFSTGVDSAPAAESGDEGQQAHAFSRRTSSAITSNAALNYAAVVDRLFSKKVSFSRCLSEARQVTNSVTVNKGSGPSLRAEGEGCMPAASSVKKTLERGPDGEFWQSFGESRQSAHPQDYFRRSGTTSSIVPRLHSNLLSQVKAAQHCDTSASEYASGQSTLSITQSGRGVPSHQSRHRAASDTSDRAPGGLPTKSSSEDKAFSAREHMRSNGNGSKISSTKVENSKACSIDGHHPPSAPFLSKAFEVKPQSTAMAQPDQQIEEGGQDNERRSAKRHQTASTQVEQLTEWHSSGPQRWYTPQLLTPLSCSFHESDDTAEQGMGFVGRHPAILEAKHFSDTPHNTSRVAKCEGVDISKRVDDGTYYSSRQQRDASSCLLEDKCCQDACKLHQSGMQLWETVDVNFRVSAVARSAPSYRNDNRILLGGFEGEVCSIVAEWQQERLEYAKEKERDGVCCCVDSRYRKLIRSSSLKLNNRSWSAVASSHEPTATAELSYCPRCGGEVKQEAQNGGYKITAMTRYDLGDSRKAQHRPSCQSVVESCQSAAAAGKRIIQVADVGEGRIAAVSHTPHVQLWRESESQSSASSERTAAVASWASSESTDRASAVAFSDGLSSSYCDSSTFMGIGTEQGQFHILDMASMKFVSTVKATDCCQKSSQTRPAGRRCSGDNRASLGHPGSEGVTCSEKSRRYTQLSSSQMPSSTSSSSPLSSLYLLGSEGGRLIGVDGRQTSIAGSCQLFQGPLLAISHLNDYQCVIVGVDVATRPFDRGKHLRRHKSSQEQEGSRKGSPGCTALTSREVELRRICEKLRPLEGKSGSSDSSESDCSQSKKRGFWDVRGVEEGSLDLLSRCTKRILEESTGLITTVVDLRKPPSKSSGSCLRQQEEESLFGASRFILPNGLISVVEWDEGDFICNPGSRSSSGLCNRGSHQEGSKSTMCAGLSPLGNLIKFEIPDRSVAVSKSPETVVSAKQLCSTSPFTTMSKGYEGAFIALTLDGCLAWSPPKLLVSRPSPPPPDDTRFRETVAHASPRSPSEPLTLSSENSTTQQGDVAWAPLVKQGPIPPEVATSRLNPWAIPFDAAGAYRSTDADGPSVSLLDPSRFPNVSDERRDGNSDLPQNANSDQIAVSDASQVLDNGLSYPYYIPHEVCSKIGKSAGATWQGHFLPVESPSDGQNTFAGGAAPNGTYLQTMDLVSSSTDGATDYYPNRAKVSHQFGSVDLADVSQSPVLPGDHNSRRLMRVLSDGEAQCRREMMLNNASERLTSSPTFTPLKRPMAKTPPPLSRRDARFSSLWTPPATRSAAAADDPRPLLPPYSFNALSPPPLSNLTYDPSLGSTSAASRRHHRLLYTACLQALTVPSWYAFITRSMALEGVCSVYRRAVSKSKKDKLFRPHALPALFRPTVFNPLEEARYVAVAREMNLAADGALAISSPRILRALQGKQSASALPGSQQTDLEQIAVCNEPDPCSDLWKFSMSLRDLKALVHRPDDILALFNKANGESKIPSLELSEEYPMIAPVVQLLYFIPELKLELVQHYCSRENCLACEVGLLWHMLDSTRKEGQSRTCQAKNFIRAFERLPESRLSGLLPYADNARGQGQGRTAAKEADAVSERLGTSVQTFFCFLIQHLRRELGRQDSGFGLERQTPAAVTGASDLPSIVGGVLNDNTSSSSSSFPNTLPRWRLSSPSLIDSLFGWSVCMRSSCVNSRHHAKDVTRTYHTVEISPTSGVVANEASGAPAPRVGVLAVNLEGVKESRPLVPTQSHMSTLDADGENTEESQGTQDRDLTQPGHQESASDFAGIIQEAMQREFSGLGNCAECRKTVKMRYQPKVLRLPQILVVNISQALSPKDGNRGNHSPTSAPSNPSQSEAVASESSQDECKASVLRAAGAARATDAYPFRFGLSFPNDDSPSGTSNADPKRTATKDEAVSDMTSLSETIPLGATPFSSRVATVDATGLSSTPSPDGTEEFVDRVNVQYELGAVLFTVADMCGQGNQQDGRGDLSTAVAVPGGSGQRFEGRHHVGLYMRLPVERPQSAIKDGPETSLSLIPDIAGSDKNSLQQKTAEKESDKWRWVLINGLIVCDVSLKEVLDVTNRWRSPCCLLYVAMSTSPQVAPPAAGLESMDLSGCFDSFRRQDVPGSAASKCPIPRSLFLSEANLSRHPSAPQRPEEVFTPLSSSEVTRIEGGGVLVALDAEFVLQKSSDSRTGEALSLARLSVARGDGQLEGVPFIDAHILAQEEPEDYLTRFSGLRPGDLSDTHSTKWLTTRKATYQKLRYLLDHGCRFLGHGLSKDFSIINLFVPQNQLIDTVELYRLPDRRLLSLRFLAHHVLGIDVHNVYDQLGHDSVEDAWVALQLHKKHQELVENGSLPLILQNLYGIGSMTNWAVESSPFPLVPNAMTESGVDAITAPPPSFPTPPPTHYPHSSRAMAASNNLGGHICLETQQQQQQHDRPMSTGAMSSSHEISQTETVDPDFPQYPIRSYFQQGGHISNLYRHVNTVAPLATVAQLSRVLPAMCLGVQDGRSSAAPYFHMNLAPVTAQTFAAYAPSKPTSTTSAGAAPISGAIGFNGFPSIGSVPNFQGQLSMQQQQQQQQLLQYHQYYAEYPQGVGRGGLENGVGRRGLENGRGYQQQQQDIGACVVDRVVSLDRRGIPLVPPMINLYSAYGDAAEGGDNSSNDMSSSGFDYRSSHQHQML